MYSDLLIPAQASHFPKFSDLDPFLYAGILYIGSIVAPFLISPKHIYKISSSHDTLHYS